MTGTMKQRRRAVLLGLAATVAFERHVLAQGLLTVAVTKTRAAAAARSASPTCARTGSR